MYKRQAVACGIDLFDSASYALYANNLRYMTSNGIFRFNNLKYLPCECEICRKYDVEDLKELPEIELKRKIALHNLYTLYREIKIIKEELDEIKIALIPEDEPTEEELKEIKMGLEELNQGKYRSWKEIKEELNV